MIESVKRRLSLIFTSAILVFSLAVMAAASYVSHLDLIDSQRAHLLLDISAEFLPVYQQNDLEGVVAMNEYDYFHVLNRNGEVVVSTLNSSSFDPGLNLKFLNQAFQGNTNEERYEDGDLTYLVVYFPLDEFYSGRGGVSLELVNIHLKKMVNQTLMAIPILVLISFLISRLLVNQAMRPIQEIFTYQEAYSDHVTHELMTPMTALKGGMEVMLRREHTPGEYQETLNGNLREVNRLIDLLKNLNLLAGPKMKPLEMETGPVSLDEMLGKLLEAKSPEFKKNRVDMEVDLTSGLVCIGDDTLLERAFGNLLDNAVKYTPPQGKFAVQAGVKGQMLQVILSNTADFTGKENLEGFFNPFFRGENIFTRKGRPIPGKGLGLSLARYILHSHKGDMSLEFGQEGRFVVKVILPLAGD